MGRLKHWADAMWSRFINSRLVQTVLRYRKILLLSLAAVVVLSAVLYLCPWRLTTVYNDIDWEGFGETCTVVYQEVYLNPDGHILYQYDVPTGALREVLENTYIRRDLFDDPWGSAAYVELNWMDARTESENTEKNYAFSFDSDGDLTCYMDLYDVRGSDWYKIDSKRGEWIVTGGEAFEGLSALLEDLEPTRIDSTFDS